MKNIALAIVLLALVITLSLKEASALELSKNEALFREDILYKLNPGTISRITGILNGYRQKISKMDTASANTLTDSILRKVDNILYKMRAAQPLDKNLEKIPDNRYLAYMLIKLELLTLKR